MTATMPRWVRRNIGTRPAVVDVPAAQLHEGSVIVDTDGATHLIDHFAERHSRYLRGDGTEGHCRVAYDAGGKWRHTYADDETVHIEKEN